MVIKIVFKLGSESFERSFSNPDDAFHFITWMKKEYGNFFKLIKPFNQLELF